MGKNYQFQLYQKYKKYIIGIEIEERDYVPDLFDFFQSLISIPIKIIPSSLPDYKNILWKGDNDIKELKNKIKKTGL